MLNGSDYPRYRYVVLIVFMLVTVAIEIQWLTHAAVARPAAVFYKGQFDPASFMNIDFLAMVYMLVFLLISFPASYIIDTYGIRTGLFTGAVLLGSFSVLKFILARSFTGMVISQTGLAVAQPFILNAVTAVTARWFPLRQRGMAAGLLALAQYIGIVVAMLLTPALVGSKPAEPGYGTGFEGMLLIYAIFSVISALLLLVFLRKPPPVNQATGNQRFSFFNGLRHITSLRDMRITLFLFLIGLGMFNAISSMTDSIAARVGVKDSDGLIGGLMLIGGILGAIIIPALSDKFGKRKLFLVICMAGMVPAVAGLSFADQLSLNPGQTYLVSLVSSAVLGFFVMSAGPIGFQYAAEVSYPAPESASQGALLWVGQLTGMGFVLGMSVQNNRYLGGFMSAFFILSLVSLAGVLLLRESPMFAGKSR
ncbi:MAG: MFS transporter [Bacteroidales bacterium]